MSKDKKKEPEMIKDSSVTLKQLIEKVAELEKTVDEIKGRVKSVEEKMDKV